MKKKICIYSLVVLCIIIGIIFILKKDKREKSVIGNDVVVEKTFEAELNEKNEWTELEFKKYNFNIALPKELITEECVIKDEEDKDILYHVRNNNYNFIVRELKYSKTDYEYLYNNYLDDTGMYDNGGYLFGELYLGNYKQYFYDDSIIVASGAILSKESNKFGYYIYVIDTEKKETYQIEFYEEMGPYYTRDFYITAQVSSTFVNSFYLSKYDPIYTIEDIKFQNRVHEKILKERCMFENKEKDMQYMIDNDIEPTFYEYAGYIETLGYFEDKAIQAAYDAGLTP